MHSRRRNIYKTHLKKCIRSISSSNLQKKTPDAFFNDLRHFHCLHKTPFIHAPIYFGRRVNFLTLYNAVMVRGGFQKVCEKHQWLSVLSETGYSLKGPNAILAIKHIYQRYLESYERFESLGHSDSDCTSKSDQFGGGDSDFVFTRTGLSSTLHSSNNFYGQLPTEIAMPLTYNNAAHRVSPSQRVQFNLSTDLVEPVEYQKLELSLLSGLPNEVDFGLNAALLLSYQPNQFHLQYNDRLVKLLVAHAGIFDYGPSSYYFLSQIWNSQQKRNLLRFWFEAVADVSARKLLQPDVFVCGKDNWHDDSIQLDSRFSLFALGHDMSVEDNEGQRCVLVATILRNCVLESAPNRIAISRSEPALRFLLLSANCRFQQLRYLALDALVCLKQPLHRCPVLSQIFERLLVDCLESSDRSHRLRGLELLSSLCRVADNCVALGDFLDKDHPYDVFEVIFCALLQCDLHLIVASLEVFLCLSGLGSEHCERLIRRLPHLLSLLLRFLTFEASQVGSEGLVNIKIMQAPVINQTFNSAITSHPSSGQVTSALASIQASLVATNNRNLLPKASVAMCNKAATANTCHNKHFLRWWLKHCYEPCQKSSTVSCEIMFSQFRRDFASQYGVAAVASCFPTAQEFYSCIKELYPRVEHVKVQLPSGYFEIRFNHLKHVNTCKSLPVAIQHLSQSSLDYTSKVSPWDDEHIAVPKKGAADKEIAIFSDASTLNKLRSSIGSTSTLFTNTNSSRENSMLSKLLNKEYPSPQSTDFQKSRELERSFSEELSNCEHSYSLEDAVATLDLHELDAISSSTAKTTCLSIGTSKRLTADSLSCSNHSNESMQSEFHQNNSGQNQLAPSEFVPDFVTHLRSRTPTPSSTPPSRPSSSNSSATLFADQFQIRSARKRSSSETLADFNIQVGKRTRFLTAGEAVPHQEDVSSTNSFLMDSHEAIVERVVNKYSQRLHFEQLNDHTKTTSLISANHSAPINGFCGVSPPASLTESPDRLPNGDADGHFEDEFSDVLDCVEENKSMECLIDNSSDSNNSDAFLPNASSSKSDLPTRLLPFTSAAAILGNKREQNHNGMEPLSSAQANPRLSDVGLLCLWAGCARSFTTASDVYTHLFSAHFAATHELPNLCEWLACPEANVWRAPYSLLAHCGERHCSADALEADLQTRRSAELAGRPTHPVAPLAPGLLHLRRQTRSRRPIYPPDAALQAVYKASYPQYVFASDLARTSQHEGPVTKHIRLSCALILRNLASSSSQAKSWFRSKEEELTEAAFAGGDSSSFVAQLLFELSQK